MLPKEIRIFIERFSKLPSIGPRLATRLAFFITHHNPTLLSELESALHGLSNLEPCDRCFSLKEKESKACDLCLDAGRKPDLIAIVEKETDRLSIEKTRAFRGRYMVLGELSEKGVLSTEQKKRIERLKKILTDECHGKAKEIIVALPPTTFGDFTAMLVTQALQGFSETITRLGRGIPTGGEIEFADQETLENAIKGRT